MSSPWERPRADHQLIEYWSTPRGSRSIWRLTGRWLLARSSLFDWNLNTSYPSHWKASTCRPTRIKRVQKGRNSLREKRQERISVSGDWPPHILSQLTPGGLSPALTSPSWRPSSWWPSYTMTRAESSSTCLSRPRQMWGDRPTRWELLLEIFFTKYYW